MSLSISERKKRIFRVYDLLNNSSSNVNRREPIRFPDCHDESGYVIVLRR